MKKILTLLVSACSGLVAFAQPQLKSNNLTIGDEFSLYSITNISPSVSIPIFLQFKVRIFSTYKSYYFWGCLHIQFGNSRSK